MQKIYKHTCEYCNRKFKTKRAVQIHMTTCVYVHDVTDEYYEVEDRVGVFDRIVNRWYLVKWTGYDIGGDQHYDIERRLNLAKARCGKLSNLFDSPNLSLHMKLRLYRAAI